MTSETRSALETLRDMWRARSEEQRKKWDGPAASFGSQMAMEGATAAYDICADELSALLTASSSPVRTTPSGGLAALIESVISLLEGLRSPSNEQRSQAVTLRGWRAIAEHLESELATLRADLAQAEKSTKELAEERMVREAAEAAEMREHKDCVAAEARCAQLRAYVQHKPECHKLCNDNLRYAGHSRINQPDECTCGLDALFTEAEQR